MAIREAIDTQIPYYLTEPQATGLKKALADFENSKPVDYFINKYNDKMLQGDGWLGLELFEFSSGEKFVRKGVILSNSCDISPENYRDVPSNILFSPLISLSRFRQKLEQSGLSNEQVDAKLNSIRKQLVTNIFYLPEGGELNDECFALLDNVHTMPSNAFTKSQEKEKLFTLSMVGFYLFTFKLSIHFCRLHEEISR